MSKKPVFAVVGHPNKGKSSIVSTLSRQDAVSISDISGTTTQSQSFAMEVEGSSLYTLVDTPGFQRPRQVLAWLEANASNASERGAAVDQFISTFGQSDTAPKFHDETELLSPIMAGAGVIYVVDGSLPYTPEYEAEMSILQWTGQPRMALINPIGGEQYVEQWQSALSQYFSVVRVFDPMTADYQKQFTVLSAFAELYEPWRKNIEASVAAFQGYFQSLEQKSVHIVVESLIDMLRNETSVNVPAQFAEEALKVDVKRRYQQAMRDIESRMQRRLKELYAHHQLELQAEQLTADYPDLFDQTFWYLFGLDRQKIVGLATSAGAAAGAVVDIGVGGASLMTGAIAGGLVSGAASLLATWRPEKLRVKGVPLAGKKIIAGPVKDINFAFVLLGRAIGFLSLVSQRTHADRRVAVLAVSDLSVRMRRLSKLDQVKLTRLLQKAHKELNEKEVLQLNNWVSKLAEREITP